MARHMILTVGEGDAFAAGATHDYCDLAGLESPAAARIGRPPAGGSATESQLE